MKPMDTHMNAQTHATWQSIKSLIVFPTRAQNIRDFGAQFYILSRVAFIYPNRGVCNWSRTPKEAQLTSYQATTTKTYINENHIFCKICSEAPSKSSNCDTLWIYCVSDMWQLVLDQLGCRKNVFCQKPKLQICDRSEPYFNHIKPRNHVCNSAEIL